MKGNAHKEGVMMNWRSKSGISKNKNGKAQLKTAWGMITPSLLVVFALSIYPLIYTLILSLSKYNLIKPKNNGFVGLAQYIEVLTDMKFWHAMRVTGYFVVVSLPVQFIFGMLIALLLNQNFKGRGFLRAIMLMPWAVPNIVNSNLWNWIFNTNYGVLNRLLMQFGIIETPIIWMGNATLAMNMLIIADSWRMLPFYAIMLLAGMQSIPVSMYEAGVIDGANAWKRFFHLTLPSLKSIILSVLIMRTTQLFKVFDIIYMMTKGGPADGTKAISFYIYETAFSSLNFGYAASLATIVALITMFIAVFYMRTIKIEE